MPSKESEISTLFTRNIRIIEAPFVNSILKAYSGKTPKDMEFDSKLFIINFDHLEKNNWGASDFLAISGQGPMILLDNLKQIDLSDRNLSRRFILFIGILYIYNFYTFSLSTKHGF